MTWQRDSNELFDFESEHLIQKTLKCTESSKSNLDILQRVGKIQREVHDILLSKATATMTSKQLEGLDKENEGADALKQKIVSMGGTEDDALFFVGFADLGSPLDTSDKAKELRVAM